MSNFSPAKIASWWCTLEDLQWPQRKVIDHVKKRAEGFAKARIDTAIIFGFHTRFDFSDYFGSLHGYLAEVSEELHKYGIKLMDHYSCNLIERPRGDSELRRMHAYQRHHVLLHPDPIAAEHAQYAGHFFRELCEVDVRDGSRGYTPNYQGEIFCHNNPGFLDMHRKYLERLVAEVPLDGAQIDDMCDYGGLSTCGCMYCRERFKRDYGHELPPFGQSDFWGNTSGHPVTWGNYENPVFRDWLRMKADSVADHVRMVKSAIGDRPLMTCCSSTGPMMLNAVSLNLERMMSHLDVFMLENCGLGVETVHWDRMDAEALQQKDIADKRGGAPAMALSYTIYDAGGYLGWSLSRFWGVGNWSSTLTGRLPLEPEGVKDIYEIVAPLNQWECEHSDLNYRDGRDVHELRLASSRFCKENGWRDESGAEHWDRVSAWSRALLQSHIGYRFIRADELADGEALRSDTTPLLLDGLACVSNAQHEAIRGYLAAGGTVWLRSPYGTHDEKGFLRGRPLSDELAAGGYAGLTILPEHETAAELLKKLVGSGGPSAAGNGATGGAGEAPAGRSGQLSPRIRQVSGDGRWAARLRIHPQGAVLHLMSRALEAIPDPELKEGSGQSVLLDIRSGNSGGRLEYVVDFAGIGEPWSAPVLASPELGDKTNTVTVERLSAAQVKVSIDMAGVGIYGVVQELSK